MGRAAQRVERDVEPDVDLLAERGVGEFDEPLDGIIYASAAALGFASLDNVFYVIYFSNGLGIRWGIALPRIFILGPIVAAHGLASGARTPSIVMVVIGLLGLLVAAYG